MDGGFGPKESNLGKKKIKIGFPAGGKVVRRMMDPDHGGKNEKIPPTSIVKRALPKN